MIKKITMAKELFTMGDWRAVLGGLNVVFADRKSLCCAFQTENITKEQAEANTLLWAASKDMYYVLKDVITWFKPEDMRQKAIMRKAVEALKKVAGK